MRGLICLVMVFVLVLPPASIMAQAKTVTYEESNEELVNPERGFYIPSGTRASNFQPLDEATLRSYRTSDQKVSNATYSVRATLLYRGYELDTFKTRPLSQEFLRLMQADFDIVRRAGLKLILRFMYTNRSHKGDCPGKDICPPYGDAPKNIVLKHIQQLKPLLQKNGDVIAILQSGFIGIWGENYYTDYFGDASHQGRLLDSNWRDRKQVLSALLDAMPKDRIVQVRTPQMKQKFMYGASAPVNSRPIDSSDAHTGSAGSRLGFHNDCFLASIDDYGTFQDYGSSTQEPGAANEMLRKYIEADTKFTAVGGETCDDAFSPQNDCQPAGYAEQEMRRMHYSYLNAAYNNRVNNDWDSAGCMLTIKKEMGYRIVLRKLETPTSANANGTLSIKLTIENKGYAAPFNPRPVMLIFKNNISGEEEEVKLDTDVRKWYSGVHQLNQSVKIPPTLKKGTYQLFLSLPDASPTLRERAEYKLIFANKNIIDNKSGNMNLGTAVVIR
jgi:hypothetical protein